MLTAFTESVLLHKVETTEGENNQTEQQGGAQVGILKEDVGDDAINHESEEAIEECGAEYNANDEADDRHDTSDNTPDGVVDKQDATEDMVHKANNGHDESKIRSSLSLDMNLDVCDGEEKNLVVLDPDHVSSPFYHYNIV